MSAVPMSTMTTSSLMYGDRAARRWTATAAVSKAPVLMSVVDPSAAGAAMTRKAAVAVVSKYLRMNSPEAGQQRAGSELSNYKVGATRPVEKIPAETA